MDEDDIKTRILSRFSESDIDIILFEIIQQGGYKKIKKMIRKY